MTIQSLLAGKTNISKRIFRLAAYFLMLTPLFCHAQGATELTALDEAMAKLQTGNYPAAIPQFEIISDCNKAIALKPAYYDPYVQRGDAYDDLGEYDKAIADYTKAISIDPAKLQAYRECAASFAHKNDYKHCLFYLERGLQIEPKNKYLLGHKFQTQRLMGDIAGAISTLNQCIKYFPASPSSL
jgi:tetratricopeptide (TPR) repeat protein